MSPRQRLSILNGTLALALPADEEKKSSTPMVGLSQMPHSLSEKSH